MGTQIAVLKLMEGGMDRTFKETFPLVYITSSPPLFLNPLNLQQSLGIVKHTYTASPPTVKDTPSPGILGYLPTQPFGVSQ